MHKKLGRCGQVLVPLLKDFLRPDKLALLTLTPQKLQVIFSFRARERIIATF